MNEKKYAKTYIVSVLLITWIITATLFIHPNTGLKLFTLIMFIPGILALIFNDIQYKRKDKIYECFTNRINKKAMLFGIFYPILFIMICSLIAFTTGIGTLTSEKIPVTRDIIYLIFASILTLPFALGEEYGWRGYLLPKLTKIYGKTKSTIIVGIVWGLYHVPIVFLLAKTTGLPNPFLLCIIQALAAFTFSFPSSYCYYLSDNIIPVLFIHSVWNSINVMMLGDIYKNQYGIIRGNLVTINGEGILGVILGTILIFGFIKVCFNSTTPRYLKN
ncbi:CPBP family intramembrane glutamic endopeptidase [Clostridium akagii]|uniref:CPBP family intramembrane glutamic endopeptidase n=1 Tax=Clostridium akagii TaxID=91623 RepID=UPI0006923195|nr:CPBP family intramembrane glutamic endopeptidase [Clostridium akagii]